MISPPPAPGAPPDASASPAAAAAPEACGSASAAPATDSPAASLAASPERWAGPRGLDTAARRGRRPAVVAALVLVLTWAAAATVVAIRLPGGPGHSHHEAGGGREVVAAALMAGAEVTLLALLVWLLTRRRTDVPDLTEGVTAEDRRRAARELLAATAYGLLMLVAARVLPPLLGWHPFSWHLAGTLQGPDRSVGPGEALAWAAFNGVVFAAVPWLWLRRRGPGRGPLCSTNIRADLVVIVVVLAIELPVQVLALHPRTLELPLRTLVVGAPLTFVLYLLGAVLPTVALQALVVPRVLVLTRSRIAAVVAGGLGYGLCHMWDPGRPGAGPLLAAALLVLTYAGPGMFKAWLTVRTGNAWVHAWAYHAFAPHVLVDTALVVAVFGV